MKNLKAKKGFIALWTISIFIILFIFLVLLPDMNKTKKIEKYDYIDYDLRNND